MNETLVAIIIGLFFSFLRKRFQPCNGHSTHGLRETATSLRTESSLSTFDSPTFASGRSDASLALGRDDRPIGVGFFLLRVALARTNGPPTLAHGF